MQMSGSVALIHQQYAEKKNEIQKALLGFKTISQDQWLREIALCLLTPQSSPLRAENAMGRIVIKKSNAPLSRVMI